MGRVGREVWLTLTYPVRRSRFMCRFLMAPKSPKRSWRSSSLASSWTLVTRTIQPSMERTATAPAAVRVSYVGGAVVVGFGLAGSSMSISVVAIMG